MSSTSSQVSAVTVKPPRKRLNAKAFWQTAVLKEKVMLVFGTAYVISPIDFMPEALMGPIGLADDATASLVLILGVAYGVAKRYREQQSGPGRHIE